jgi:hypothetical protein
VLVQPPPDHLLDQVVTHQLAAGHAPPASTLAWAPLPLPWTPMMMSSLRMGAS